MRTPELQSGKIQKIQLNRITIVAGKFGPEVQYAGGCARGAENLLRGIEERYPNSYVISLLALASKGNATDCYPNLSIAHPSHLPGIAGYFLRGVTSNHPGILHLNSTFCLDPKILMALSHIWHGPVSAKISSFGVVNNYLLLCRRIGRNILQKLDCCVAISPEILSGLRELGVPEGRIRYIPDGVNTDFFHPLDRQAKKTKRRKLVGNRIGENGRVFIYTGRITNQFKHIGLLLKSWAESGLDRAGHALVMVGPLNNDLLNQGALIARRSGVKRPGWGNHNVLWTGGLTQAGVVDYLQAADVFVLPSDLEGLCNSLQEALACGLPAVVRRGVSGNSSLVADQKTGFYFDGDSGLVDALRSAARVPVDRLQEMGDAAREHVSKNFPLSATVDGYHQMFQELLQPAPIAGPSTLTPNPYL